MMRYISLKHRPRHFLAFTGLKVEEFAKLVANIHSDWIQQRIEHLTKNNLKRKRKFGGGRKKILSSLEDQLLLTLFWAKHYPSYLLLEYLFGIDKSTVCRTIQDVKLLLQDKSIFPKPRKGKKFTILEELKEVIPEFIREP